MAGLGGDAVEVDAGRVGGGGVSGAQGVAGDPGGGQSGGLGAGVQQPGQGVRGERVIGDCASAESDEQWSGSGAARLDPGC
jgi:hypothetical protein